MPVLYIKTSEANDALNDLLSAKKEMKELLENLKKTSETLKRVRSSSYYISDYQVKVNQEKKKVEIDIYKLEGFIKSYASFLEYAQTRDNSCGSTLSDSGYKYRSDTGLLSKEQDKESEDKKKIAIGVGIIGGLALTAFFLPVLLPELAAAGMVANACGNAALWGGIFGVIGYEKDGADGWLKGVLEGSSGSLLSELGEGKLTIEFLTNMAQGSINSYIENGDLSIDESAIDALESMVLSLTGKKIKATSTMTKENISAPEFKNVNDINKGVSKAGDEMVTYRRVQGGTPPNASWTRITVDESGNIKIPNKKANLNVSTGNDEHAKYFLSKRGSNAEIVEFDIPTWLDDFLQENAINQKGYRKNPLNQGGTAPKIVDPTTPGNSYELPAPWIEWLEEYGKNGRRIK